MENEELEHIRHSLAHLLAAAVLKLWPDTKITLGPTIENGFYYDFDFIEPISDDDLPKIEKKMRELLKRWNKFEQTNISEKESRKMFEGNQYKQEIIDDYRNEQLSIVKSGEFIDLCRGGHVENAGDIDSEAFKLTHIAGAYWRGNERNKMLTRIYGVAFETPRELDEYLAMIEEAKKRDHRKIGKDLDLFVFSDLVGKGLPLFTSKGATIRRELERFVVDEEIKRGYEHVITPPLAKVDLYRTSGHFPYYKDTMYPPMKIDDDELILRPMTCPHHFMLYKSRPHSYKELPIKYAELSPQFRYEKSGELTGLSRVRMFCLADAHIFTAVEQAKEVISDVLSLIEYANGVFGLEKGKDYRYRLSLGDRKDDKKYFKDDEAWDEAEGILRDLLKDRNEPFFEADGEAAFYGPKIDIQMKKASGTEETAFTVQYDFVMPKRFNLTYIDSDGKEKQPVVIHRSSIGAVERIMAFLIEFYAGAFPLWLSPVQVKILPISDKLNSYAGEISEKIKEAGVRVEIDDRSESIGKKIRENEMQKIPVLLIVGEKEKDAGTVSLRRRNIGDVGQMKIEEIISTLLKEIVEKK